MIEGPLVARDQPLALGCLLGEMRLQDQGTVLHSLCRACRSNPNLAQFSEVPERGFLLVCIVLTVTLCLLHEK